MGKWGIGMVYKLNRGLKLIGWVMLEIVKIGESLVSEAVAIAVVVL